MTGHCWQCTAPLGSDGLFLEPKIIPKIQRLQRENNILKKKIESLKKDNEIYVSFQKENNERKKRVEQVREYLKSGITLTWRKDLKEILGDSIKPKDSEWKYNPPREGQQVLTLEEYRKMNKEIESLKSQAKQWVNRNFELSNEVDRLKKTAGTWQSKYTKAESELDDSKIEFAKAVLIIEQAVEHFSSLSGATQSMDIIKRFKEILEGST